jgi:hypothetical protein
MKIKQKKQKNKKKQKIKKLISLFRVKNDFQRRIFVAL